MQTSGQQTFIDKELVYPGEEVEVEIAILGVDFFQNQLTEGMDSEEVVNGSESPPNR